MRHKGVWIRGRWPSFLVFLMTVGGCNSGGEADGLGGAADDMNQDSSGGRADGVGGNKPASGGKTGTGGAQPGAGQGPVGGWVPVEVGGNGGLAGAPGSGGSGEQGPEPRWLAFQVSGGNESPLVLARSDGSVDAITVFDNISGFSGPSWSADGESLVFVEYFCCGFSNGAYAIEVGAKVVGSPTLIHEPLGDGSTIRYAAYSPNGQHILGRFVDSNYLARYALRRRDAEPSEWTFVTEAAAWGASDPEPAWSPDGRSVLLAQGQSQTGVSLYRVDMKADKLASIELLHLPPGGNEELQELKWSKDSTTFVVSGSHSLRLGRRDDDDLVLISEGEANSVSSGEGGSAGEVEVPEYGPHFPLEFSPDSERLLYGSHDDAYGGSMRLWGIELGSAAGPDKRLLLEPTLGQSLALGSAGWDGSSDVFVSADREGRSRYDVLHIDWDSKEVEPRARIPEGETSLGFAWLRDGVIYHTQDSDYVPNHLYFVGHQDTPEDASLLFEFADDVTPGWANFLGVPTAQAGGFFTAYEFDEATGQQSRARLWHFTPEGTLELVMGPLEGSGAFADPGVFDAREEQFAFTYDYEGDYFYEVGVTRKVNGKFTEPVVAAELLDIYSSTPFRLVWQP
jgi:Tol biopolymer transport system component